MHIKILFALLSTLWLSYSYAQEPFYYFDAPQEWKIADPKNLSTHVKISFVGKGKQGFHPSINLACETTHLSQEEYVAQVQKIHEANRDQTWRDLSRYSTAAGIARLTEIDTPTDWGSVRLLQLLFVKNKTAYILTACATKKEFSNYYPLFQKAFSSFNVIEDPLETLANTPRKNQLQKMITQYKTSSDNWEPMQKLITEQFSDMGTCWQLFTLKYIAQKS